MCKTVFKMVMHLDITHRSLRNYSYRLEDMSKCELDCDSPNVREYFNINYDNEAYLEFIMMPNASTILSQKYGFIFSDAGLTFGNMDFSYSLREDHEAYYRNEPCMFRRFVKLRYRYE